MLDWQRINQFRLHVALTLVVVIPATVFGQSSSQDDPTPTDQSQPAPAKHPDPGPLAPSVFNLSVNGGRGLIRTMSPYALEPGKIGVSASAMNFDRNPGDIDFFEYPFSLVLGLPGRTEVFLRASPVLRTNSVGQDPLGFPIPPLDLFVDTYPSLASRLGPKFLFAQEVPFKSYDFPTVVIDPPGHGAFSQSSGDIALGAKVNLLSEDRQNRMGLGLRAYVEIPTEKPRYNTPPYHERAGVSGKTDMGLDLLAAKRFAITELLVNVGYKHVGDPDRGIRIQYVDSSRTDAGFLVGQPEEIKLDLHDRLDLAAGASFPVFAIMQRQVWLLTEFNYTRYIGHGVPVERLVHPAELRLGLQLNFPWYKPLAMGMAFQMQLNGGGNGDLRTTFFRTPDGKGDINFGENVDPQVSTEVKTFLASRGATFSPNSSKVFSTDNPEFDGWRTMVTVPQRVIAQGNGNLLAFITWRIN
jgi:hypothetical protein